MSLLQPLALLLLAALGVLGWLAFLQRGAIRQDVGTLFIWRRVAALPQARRRKPRVDALLWLVGGALLVAAVGAARPVQALEFAPEVVVAVYIERLSAPHSATEPLLAEAGARAEAAAPGARLEFYFGGRLHEPRLPGVVRELAPGDIQEELAQFQQRSAGAQARMLLLCEPVAAASAMGLVLPRVTAQRQGVPYRLEVRGRKVLLHSSGMAPPSVEGASLAGARFSGGNAVREYDARESEVRIAALGIAPLVLRETPRRGLAVGGQWKSDVHRALLEALLANARFERSAGPELGLDTEAPRRLELLRGERADLSGVEVSFRAGHALFEELPLSSLDWLSGGRLLEPSEERVALVSALRGGQRLGDLVAVSLDQRVLTFAADPFADSHPAAAALLLDNALGVVLGERPSRQAHYAPVGELRLPSERAALAAPFEPGGNLAVEENTQRRSLELTSWLALTAMLAALGAAWLTR